MDLRALGPLKTRLFRHTPTVHRRGPYGCFNVVWQAPSPYPHIGAMGWLAGGWRVNRWDVTKDNHKLVSRNVVINPLHELILSIELLRVKVVRIVLVNQKKWFVHIVEILYRKTSSRYITNTTPSSSRWTVAIFPRISERIPYSHCLRSLSHRTLSLIFFMALRYHWINATLNDGIIHPSVSGCFIPKTWM